MVEINEIFNKSTDELQRMSAEETKSLFSLAQNEGVLDEFSDYYWKTFRATNFLPSHLQNVLNVVEIYKRSVGRCIAKTNDLSKKAQLAKKYAELEDDINYLVVNFNLTRHSKPYKTPTYD